MTENNDFFFWLEPDGELTELTSETFNDRIDQERRANTRWSSVDLSEYGGDIV